MRLRIAVPLFSVVVLVLPGSTSAQTSNSSEKKESSAAAQRHGSIQGTVYDPDGRAVAGARVSLLDSASAVAEIQTDSQGKYRFGNLASGAFRLAANFPGFVELSARIDLQAAETRTFDLHLKVSAVQEQVVVSASLGGELAPQIGSSVSVVSREEIEDRGTESASDALRGIPGLEIIQSGTRGAVTSAFIRGGDSDYNLVMVDGIPLNDFGGSFDLATLPADGVDHIEIIRGPESALYGSNAVAGVINIVSQQGEGAPHFSFMGEGGSYYTSHIAAGGAGLNHGLSWAYDLSRFQTRGPVEDDNDRNQTSFASLGYSRSPRRRLNLHFFGDAAANTTPGPYGSDPDGLFPGISASAGVQNRNMFGYQANYTEQFSSRFQQVTSVSAETDRFSFSSASGDSFVNNLRLVVNTRSEFRISGADVFVAGFEYNHENFKDTYVADANNDPFDLPRDAFAFFAENRWNPRGRWFLTTGLRVDNIQTGSLPTDAYGSRPFIPAASVTQVDPRISLAYVARQPSGGVFGITRLHGSFGTGIRPPSGFELAFTNNPGLKPERSISVDGGIEQRLLGDHAVIDVTYFYNRFKDQIVTLGGSLQNLSTFSSANLANCRAYGLENSLRLRPARSLELTADYTWLNTAILAVDGTNQVAFPFAVGEPLIRRPHNSADYNVTWTHGRLILNTNATIRGAVLDLEPNYGSYACTLGLQCLFTNKGYVDANAGFAYALPRGVELFGHLNNLANQKYEEAFGFPSLRLNFMAGIKINLPAEHAYTHP
ncbi:MAG TPA: TonB-dependent receptor [Candidatus Acidoferrum sp.]|nr:TonB-dependent receptor [Candidatus Acidoferrum sp.]